MFLLNPKDLLFPKKDMRHKRLLLKYCKSNELPSSRRIENKVEILQQAGRRLLPFTQRATRAAQNAATHWRLLGMRMFRHFHKQGLEHSKTLRYNQSKLVFTELVDVCRFIGGRKAKLQFNLWTVAFCKCTGVQSIDPQSMAVSFRNHTRVLEM